MLVMGLRIAEGVDLARLARLTGLAPSVVTLDKLARHDLARVDPVTGHLRTTARGRFLTNAIVLDVSRGLEAAAVLNRS